MASADRPNGTVSRSPFPKLPSFDFSSLPPASSILGKRRRHSFSVPARRFGTRLPLTSRTDTDIDQGRPWNAQALLAPRKFNSSAPAPPIPNHAATSGKADPEGRPNGAGATNALSFQFSSPSDSNNTHSAPSTAPSTATTPSTNGQESSIRQGMGNMIERINDVQDRSSVPQAKRRKVDTPEADAEAQRKAKGHGAGSGGALGAYVKEKREEGQRNNSARSSQTVDLTDGDDDVSVVQDPESQEVCYGMANGKLLCNIVPSPKPGVKSIYGDGWCPAVKVVLKRIAGDKTLRVQAYDFTREIIGNVDPKTADALVPILDANIRLRTDCQIPPRRKQGNEEPGQRISKGYPFNIILYGPKKYGKAVGKHFNDRGMPLRHPNRVDKGVEYVNVNAIAVERPKDKQQQQQQQGQGSNGGISYAPGSTITPRTVEEIRADVMGVFDSMGKSEDLPELDAPSIVTTPLLKHQKQGLYFMSAKEATATTEERTKGSFYQVRVGNNGQKFFYNVITGHTERQLPRQSRGGILADMMGLGKTLSILSLICSTKNEARAWADQETIQPEAPPQKQTAAAAAGNALGLSRVNSNAKTTLLVCPLSTATNWEEQIKQHIAPGQLSYYVYHGSNRIKDVQKLADYDLIITTYGSVSSELGARNKRKSGKYPLEEIGWFRIVLDEAHMIREVGTLQFKAIVRLQASRRWAVTGTPVQNRLEDLAALLSFLRVKPFDDRNRFNRFIVDPFKACDPEIVPKLRVLVDSITLRRLKDKINLPPRTDQVVKLEFTPEERQVYDLFEKNAQDRVKVLAGEGVNKALGGQTYIHILRSILRLRLLCAHGKDLLNDEDLEALQGMTADLAIDLDSDEEDSSKPALSDRQAYEMFELMQETNADMCSRCNKKLGANDSDNIESEGQEDLLGYMTPCFHVICGACIRAVRDQAKSMPGKCPFCPKHVNFSCVELRRTRANAEHDGHIKAKGAKSTLAANKRTLDRYEGPHTKTRALVEDLLKHEADSEANPTEPPFKSVVFSGWTSHLDLIQLALDDANIFYTRLDGTMSRLARTGSMDKFRDDPSVHVILVSITAGGLGLNLTAGNNVYVMEPQYNPAAEAQAIDRVHRLGQRRAVRTVRYIMSNSFEEKMIELQEKKKKLASLSMDQKDKAIDKGDAARQKLMDLRSLFK